MKSGQTISHYKILQEIGHGGMGIVYKAEDTTLKRIVALKFLPEQLSTEANTKARFMQEAQTASAINHPNVCIIHDIQEYQGQQFIVMEYVEGQTLRDVLKQKTLSIQNVEDFALQIVEGLAAAHKKGIIHRDIKSENIMVNAENKIKVMDFGLARIKGAARLTRTSSTAGTAAYMSPEQIQGQDVDARSDIFSLGECGIHSPPSPHFNSSKKDRRQTVRRILDSYTSRFIHLMRLGRKIFQKKQYF